MFSFAEERLTFTAYYPSPNAYYNRLNATDLTVTNHAHVGHSLGVGVHITDAEADISIIKAGDAASLMMIGQGGMGSSNHAELILASPGIVDPNDPSLWALTHSADQNKLTYVQHNSGDLDGSTGDPIFKSVLTMDTGGNMGLNTTSPQAPFHVLSPQRDLMRLDSNSAEGTGIMFRNRHADMGADQYFGMGWGGSAASGRSNKLNFWYAGSNTNYDNPPIMTFNKNEHVGIRNRNPNFTLDVNGGARINTTATGEEFKVLDTGQGSVDEVIWYRYSTGRLYLGNRGAPSGTNSEVVIRDNLDVNNNLTVGTDLTARNGIFTGGVQINTDLVANNNSRGTCAWEEKPSTLDDSEVRNLYCSNERYLAGIRTYCSDDCDDMDEDYIIALYCCEL